MPSTLCIIHHLKTVKESTPSTHCIKNSSTVCERNIILHFSGFKRFSRTFISQLLGSVVGHSGIVSKQTTQCVKLVIGAEYCQRQWYLVRKVQRPFILHYEYSCMKIDFY